MNLNSRRDSSVSTSFWPSVMMSPGGGAEIPRSDCNCSCLYSVAEAAKANVVDYHHSKCIGGGGKLELVHHVQGGSVTANLLYQPHGVSTKVILGRGSLCEATNDGED